MSFATTFFELYNQFSALRNAALAVDGVPRQNGPQVDFILQVTRFVASHRRTDDEVDRKFEAMRKSGRNVLRHVVVNRKALLEEHESMEGGGFPNLLDVLVMTAPLDALNWVVMKNAESGGHHDITFHHKDGTFNRWAVVAALNKEAKDLPVAVLEIIAEVQTLAHKGIAASDPFPESTIRHIRAGCAPTPALPESLRAQADYVASIYEPVAQKPTE